MAVVPQTTCDRRGRHQGEAEPYRICFPSGEEWIVDLCDNHRPALEVFAQIGRLVEKRRRHTWQKTDIKELMV